MEKHDENNVKIEKTDKKPTGLIINILKRIDKSIDDTLKFTYM